MSLLFLFLDGIGIAEAGEENPFTSHWAGWERLSGGVPWTEPWVEVDEPGLVRRGIDANLGLDGLPQSGTGQATLFSGVNCAERAGRHFGPYPHSTSKPVLTARSIFLTAMRQGKTAAFANAYPSPFFQFVRKRNRWTVTTLMAVEAGIRLRTSEDLKAGTAIPANITGKGWPDGGIGAISEEVAALRLANLSAQHDLTLFEYYLTDKAGHKQDLANAAKVIGSLDRFFEALVGVLSPDITIVLTSDHGNLEDLSTKSHTRNPVPFVARGPAADAFKEVRSLVDVAGAVGSALMRG
ncbi:MAG: alkaline phosphatase family protein [Bacteroidota bacterium]